MGGLRAAVSTAVEGARPRAEPFLLTHAVRGWEEGLEYQQGEVLGLLASSTKEEASSERCFYALCHQSCGAMAPACHLGGL